VFENRVLRRVFGPKSGEVTGEWRKLHSEELNDLYSLPNIVRVVKSRRMRWEDNIKMDVQEVAGGRGDWMELAQDRDRWRALVNTVKKLRVP
jgi:hypothetical protein